MYESGIFGVDYEGLKLLLFGNFFQLGLYMVDILISDGLGLMVGLNIIIILLFVVEIIKGNEGNLLLIGLIEIYEVFQCGIVDGVILLFIVVFGFKLDDVSKYYYVVLFGGVLGVVFMI